MMKRYIDIIIYKALADLRAEAARGYLGFIWWVLDPVIYMSVFYVVLTVLRHSEGEGVVEFLLCGLVVWKWFASSINHGANSIAGSAGLMRQVYLPKFIFPCIALLSNTIKFFVVFSIFLAFLLIRGEPITHYWFAVPLLLIIQFCAQLAITGLLAIAVPFVPDIKVVIENSIMLLFFLSGVLFDISKAPDIIRPYLYLNPMAVLVEGYRGVLLNQHWPDWGMLLVVLVMSLIGMAVGAALIHRYDRIIPKVLFR